MSALTLEEIQAARLRVSALWNEVSRQRQKLTERIGPRGLMIGIFVSTAAEVTPLHVSSPKEFIRLWRALPESVREDRHDKLRDLRSACARWDAEARRNGLFDLEREASLETEHFKRLMKNWSDADLLDTPS